MQVINCHIASQVRFLLADRLLLGLGPGGPLPLPALYLLVALLTAADAGSSTDRGSSISSGSASEGPAAAAKSAVEAAAAESPPDGALAAVALRAAQLWGDVGALRQLPPPRQVGSYDPFPSPILKELASELLS